jgi:hypothetical protein
LLKARSADEQVRVDRFTGSGEQLSDDSVLPCDALE